MVLLDFNNTLLIRDFSDRYSTGDILVLGLSQDIINIIHWITYTALCQTISTFGVVTNIINIVCFLKQGFKDPVNVSFIGLAISDIGCLLTMTVANICFTPAFRSADLPVDATEFAYLTGGIPHTTFTRITSWFTAVITLERCLCITAPLKVKHIITSRRMTILLVCVFLTLIGSVSPVYVVNRMAMKFFPDKNKTLLGLFYTEDREVVERFSFAVNNTFLPFTAFVIIITCTIVLTVALNEKTKWRTLSVSTTQADTVSNRNKRVAKMVVMISVLFIVCFIPLSVIFLAMCLVPEFSVYGKYREILFTAGGFGFILETINSSMNIFIYYRMSSKYKHEFCNMFGFKRNTLSD